MNRIRIQLAAPLITIALASGALAENGKKYALLVGVERYDPTQLLRLQFAEDDALALGEELEAIGFDVVVMSSQSEIPHRTPASADGILDQLDRRLVDRAPEDTVVVFLCGHGVQLKNDPVNEDGAKETYFCPELADLSDRSTLVPLSVVMERMADCEAGRKLLLVDACRDEAAPQEIAARTVEVELDPAGVSRRGIPRGMIALLSCRANERSFEIPDLEHGVFTHHILEYLQGIAPDNRYPDHELSVTELAVYVTRETRDYIDRRFSKDQRPELIAPGGISDWSLGELVRRRLTNSIGMELTLIPPGEFLMGGDQSAGEAARNSGDADESSNYENEHPQHGVRITQPLYMGVYEVTQAEWQAVMGSNPSKYSQWRGRSNSVVGLDTSRFPVENLSWYDAIEFCNRLSLLEGLSQYYRTYSIRRVLGSIIAASVRVVGGDGYRLPTEAEWEYACRAGTTTPFHFGTSSNGQDANVNGGIPYGTAVAGPFLERTTMVGTYEANGFGLHDMHGNVWEWCFDCYQSDAYAGRNSITNDPVVMSADEDLRVSRGGSWLYIAGDSRSASRNKFSPARRAGSFGFRVARNR